jgi:ferredoxin
MAINVIIKDPQWNEIWGFTAENWKNIAELAAMHWIDIPVSCWAGVCWVCLCKVEAGNNVIKWDAFNSPLMPLKNNENWEPEEVLTCIAWFDTEKFDDGKDYNVILKRTY